MENSAETYRNFEQAEIPDMPYGVPYGISGFLAWVLMVWLRLCLTGGRYRCDTPYWQNGQHQQADGRNRKQRRMDELHFARRPVPASRSLGFYYRYIRPGKTPGQFMEWLARYSGRGRVSVYRMRYWRKTVKGKAAPLGTEHEYWRDPPEYIGKHASRLSCGLWAGHLWPGWPDAPKTQQNATPRSASRVDIGACLIIFYRYCVPALPPARVAARCDSERIYFEFLITPVLRICGLGIMQWSLENME